MAQENDFAGMQEEALRRVREMQRRAQQAAAPESPLPLPAKDSEAGGAEGRGKKLFSLGGIEIDEEKALIALMIYVLYKNHADMKLLLGLAYLLI